VVRNAPAGTCRLGIEHVSGPPPKAGEWLELRWFNDRGTDSLLGCLYGGVIPPGRMGAELRNSRGARVLEWVRVMAASRDVLVIRQPLRIDARPQWRPTLVRAPFVQEVGIEGLTIEFPRTEYPGHLRERGYNGIYMAGVVNGWVRDVRTVNADSGIFVNRCRYVTVSDVTISGRKMHHCLSMSWSADCLCTRWRIEAPHVHGTTISWCAHGNVYSDGWARSLAMDAHRAASFQNLHTNIVIEHGSGGRPEPFRSGGGAGRGPHAAKQNVYWNIEYRFATASRRPLHITGHKEWPHGIFVGWWGNRPLRFEAVEGLRQQVVQLNRHPVIEDLHRFQRGRRPKRAAGSS
jgi:hypothetical protein